MTVLEEDTSNELRVSGHTSTTELASAIAHAIYANKQVRMRAIGAGAVNQAVKGLAKAQGYVAQQGYVLACRPGFTTVVLKKGEEDPKERTAMVFHVFVMN